LTGKEIRSTNLALGDIEMSVLQNKLDKYGIIYKQIVTRQRMSGEPIATHCDKFFKYCGSLEIDPDERIFWTGN
jgi:hypothetical protein